MNITAREPKVTVEMAAAKLCRNCFTRKPVTEYYVCRSNRGGLMGACKSCQAASRKLRLKAATNAMS